MAPRKETTIAERNIIIRLHNETKSLAEISRIVGRARSTVQSIIKRYGINKTNKNAPRSGRKCKLNVYDERSVVRLIKKNPRLSAPKICTALAVDTGKTVSPSTIRRTLKKGGYNGRVARRKYFVSKVNKIKRLEFAKQYEHHDMNYWKKVIFTDESKYNIFGSDGRCRVWRKKNTELKKENLKGTVKHGGGSVMVWGCMSASGVGKLHFIDGIMDQYVYIDILKQNLRASAEKMGLYNDFIFQQDNDPKHSALNARLYVLYNTPHYMKTPPQSPDVNPIEHLWDELERRIRTRKISNKVELKQALQEEWLLIEEKVTQNLVESMQRRLKAIIKSKGYPTKY